MEPGLGEGRIAVLVLSLICAGGEELDKNETTTETGLDTWVNGNVPLPPFFLGCCPWIWMLWSPAWGGGVS